MSQSMLSLPLVNYYMQSGSLNFTITSTLQMIKRADLIAGLDLESQMLLKWEVQNYLHSILFWKYAVT